MRVLLIRPPYSQVYELFSQTVEKNVFPPLGLMYVASTLESAGHKVRILDAELENVIKIKEQVGSLDPEIVGVGATTPEFGAASYILKQIKTYKPEVTTVIGGIHASVLPDETLRENPHIDFIVRGEGERTMLELAQSLENNSSARKVKGISFRDGNVIRHNPRRPVIKNLDELPYPARHLIKQSEYVFPIHGKRVPVTAMISTRGCPYRCIFCYNSKSRTPLRFRQPAKVVDEIEHVVNKYKINTIQFFDDTFTISRSRVIELCNEIIRRRLDIEYSCLARADTLDEELVKKLKQSGAKKISIGVESGNQEILNIVDKRTTLSICKTAFKLLKRHKITARASFMLGLPYDTKKSIRETIEFAMRLDVDRAFFNICTPYPGSILYGMAVEGKGLRLLSKDWREFRRWGNAVIELDDVSREELIELQKKAMNEFYLRPKILLNHIEQYLRGNRSRFYYRPLMFAIKRSIGNKFHVRAN